MNQTEIAKLLSEIDSLDEWINHCPLMGREEKKEIYALAEKMWIARMVREQKLLIHPEVSEQLELQSWVATDVQKRMIWASVLASAHGDDSKARFRKVKESLINKYGREWWEDVYKRQKPAWAAKERIRKYKERRTEAVDKFISNTHIGACAASDEVDQALRMIPKI